MLRNVRCKCGTLFATDERDGMVTMCESCLYPEDGEIEVSIDKNNGGDTDYYNIPKGASVLQDLIEYKNMNFSQGNIIKAVYRMNDYSHSSAVRDLNKVIWYAQREIKRIKDNE